MGHMTWVRVWAIVLGVMGMVSIVLASTSQLSPVLPIPIQRDPLPSQTRVITIAPSTQLPPGTIPTPSRSEPMTTPDVVASDDTIIKPSFDVGLVINRIQIKPTSASPITKKEVDGVVFFERNMVFDINGGMPTTTTNINSTTAKVVVTGGPYGDTYLVNNPKTALANLWTGCSDATVCLDGDPMVMGNTIIWPAYKEIKVATGVVNDVVTFDVNDVYPKDKRIVHVTVNRRSTLSSLSDITSVKVDLRFWGTDEKAKFKIQLLDESGTVLGDTDYKYSGKSGKYTVSGKLWQYAAPSIVQNTYPIMLKKTSSGSGAISDIAKIRVSTDGGGAMIMRSILVQGKDNNLLVQNSDLLVQNSTANSGVCDIISSNGSAFCGKIAGCSEFKPVTDALPGNYICGTIADYPVKAFNWFSAFQANETVNPSAAPGSPAHSTPTPTMPICGYDEWCGGGCFTRRMRVRMWNRKKKRIADLVLGDEVLSIDLCTGALCKGTVGRIFVHEDLTELLVLNGVLEVTPNHPFWSRGRWVEAQHLELGDEVMWLGADGDAGEPMSVVIESKDLVPLLEPVYNIELAEIHLEAYFVEDFLVQH